MLEYVEELLEAVGADVSFPATKEYALPEPLTSREEEVLELMAVRRRRDHDGRLSEATCATFKKVVN